MPDGLMTSRSEPGARDRPSPLPVPDSDLVDQLHAACLLAVRHDPTGTSAAYSPTEYETVRSAVARFVAWCGTEVTPERILVLLKRVVSDALRTVGREPHEEVLRAIVLEAFLHSYYADGTRREVLDSVDTPGSAQSS